MSLIDSRYLITYDNPVYSDEDLGQEVDGPFPVKASTCLPENLYFSDDEYVGTCENSKGSALFSVTFTYPDHIVSNPVDGTPCISTDKGAVYS